MAKDKICKCNMCDNTLIDENPQIGAKEFELMGVELNMQWSGTENAWVCPVCKTDAYLTDVDEYPNGNINVQAVIGARAYHNTHTLTRNTHNTCA